MKAAELYQALAPFDRAVERALLDAEAILALARNAGAAQPAADLATRRHARMVRLSSVVKSARNILDQMRAEEPACST